MNLPIDQQIDLAHAEVERIESEARQIEARIIAAGGIPPKRPYGKPVSSADVGRNLTLKSVLQRRDPALAAFLGVGSDLHRREQEAATQREAMAQRMQQQTEALRGRNAAQRMQREQAFRSGVQPLTNRRMV